MQTVYPLPQPLPLKLAGRLISYVFHPLFIPVYISAYLIYLHPYTFAALQPEQKFIRLISLFVITCFFPAVTVFLLWRLKFAGSIFLRTQKERIIPYIASIIYYWWAFYVSRTLPGSPLILTFFLLGLFLSVSAALMANNYFKISMHGLGVGGAMAYFILLGMVTTEPMGAIIAIVTLITGVVCTARLIVSDHHPMEVYLGLILGALCQMIGYWVIM
jgi:hypothetical protein